MFYNWINLIDIMKVLVAMRNRPYAEYLSYKLKNEGNIVQIADDGLSALKLMKGQYWDIVLIGILLEYYSGLEVIAEYRKYCKTLSEDEKEAHAKIKIMIITRVRSEQARKSARSLGISEYMELPLNTSILMKKILLVGILLLCLFLPVNAQEWKKGLQSVGANYYIEHVSEPTGMNWQLLSAEAALGIGKEGNHFRTVWIPRLNLGQRTGNGISFFDHTSLQVQLETYLLFTSRFNITGSYAYSNSSRFPAHQASLELNYMLNKGWGISGGANVTHWNNTVSTYMVGVEKYVGPFWLTLKPMVVIESGEAFMAVRMGVRYYYSDEVNNYLHLGLLYGNSPEYANYLPDLRYILSLGSWGGYLSWQQKLNSHFLIRLSATYRSEEYSAKKWRNVFGANVGLTYKF